MVTFMIHGRARNPSITRDVVLVSSAGARLSSFFDGLRPIKGYVDGKMYKKKSTPMPGCSKKQNLVERIAIALGLEQVAKAQAGQCDPVGCNGCWMRIRDNPCEYCGEGYYIITDSGGDFCKFGFYLNGPACASDGCCAEATCQPSEALCCP
jgi:hypothetical protein